MTIGDNWRQKTGRDCPELSRIVSSQVSGAGVGTTSGWRAKDTGPWVGRRVFRPRGGRLLANFNPRANIGSLYICLSKGSEGGGLERLKMSVGSGSSA